MPRKGSLFVLRGLRRCLHAPGQWFYDNQRKRVLLIPPDGKLRLNAGLEHSGAGNCGFGYIFRLRSGAFPVTHVRPAAMLTDVGHLHEVGIQSRVGHTLAEGRLMHTGRTRSHHHPVQIILLDVALDLLLSRFGTGVLVLNGTYHIRKG